MKFQSSVRRISRPWIPYDKRQFRAGVNAAMREMGKIAIEMTSGTIPESTLKRERPFSRLRPKAGFPKLPINAHSKQLRDSLRIVRRVRSDGEEIFLKSNHPHAAVLAKKGLNHMVPRGFMEAFAKRTRGILLRNVQTALRRK